MEPCVASVGTFDGPHKGHIAIFEKMQEIAAEKGLKSRVITFLNHPLSVLAPEKSPRWVMDREIELGYIQDFVDSISQINFTEELAAMTASEFMVLLRQRYNATVLVMGYDNGFGSDRLATREEYVEAGRNAGLEILFAEAVNLDGCPISSSRIRKAILGDDVLKANEMLYQALSFSGEVVKGKQLGRRIGFPTMNLKVADDVTPLCDGVYFASYISEDDECYDALLSVGTNPTVNSDTSLRTYELHVIGQKLGNLYDTVQEFTIFYKMRDIEKYSSVKELREAIRNDINVVKLLKKTSRLEAENKETGSRLRKETAGYGIMADEESVPEKS